MRDKISNLGKQLNFFPVRKREVKRWITLVSGVFLILASIGLILYLFLTGWTAVENHGRAVLIKLLPFILPSILIIFPLGVALILYSRLHWWDAVSVFENGLRIYKGFRRIDLYWEDVEQFDTRVTNIKFAGNAINTRIKLIIKPRNKRPVIINNKYRKMSELIRLIRLNTLPILTKQAHDQMNNGQEVYFHKELIASKTGLSVNGKRMNWTDFGKPTIKNRILNLKDKNGEEDLFKSNINRVNNLDLLLSLIANPPNISSISAD